MPLIDHLRHCLGDIKRLEPHIAPPKAMQAMARRLRPRIIGAQRYVLADDVTALAARAAFGRATDSERDTMADRLDSDLTDATVWSAAWEDPELLAAALPQCRPPFPSLWVEWSHPAALRGMNFPVPEDGAKVAGALVEQVDDAGEQWRMTPITPTADADTPQAGIWISPVSIALDLSDPSRLPNLASGTRFPDITIGMRDRLDLMLLGPAMSNVRGNPRALAAMETLAHHANFCPSVYTGPLVTDVLATSTADSTHREAATRTMIDAMRFIAGDYRFLLGCFALLNTRSGTITTRQAQVGQTGADRYRGRRYLEHRIVEIHAPARYVIRDIAGASGYAASRKRRHMVAGHWCYGQKVGVNAGRPDCAHTWDAPGESRQTCTDCGQKRWWREAHERGDAALGYITQDRLVTL